MGIVYQLPSLVDEKQLQSVVRILDATLPSSAQRGVVFYLGQTRNGPPPIDDVEKIVGGTIPKTYRRVFHLPFTSRYVDPRFRLDDPQSDQVLRPYLDLAHRLECKSVIVHTGTNYYHPQAILPAGTDPQYQWGNRSPAQLEQSRRDVYRRLRSFAVTYPFSIALENSPFPKNVGSAGGDFTRFFLNPLATTEAQIKDFVAYAKYASRRLGVCLDTNHYLRMLSTLQFYDHQDPAVQALFAAVGEERDSSALLPLTQHLLDEARLFVVQFADNTGWHPEKKSLNATAPRTHAHQLRLLVDMIDSHPQLVPLSVEVDEMDYLDRPRQQKTLEWILSGVETPLTE